MTILERVRISRADVDRGVQPITWSNSRSGQERRFIGTTSKRFAHPDSLVYSEWKRTQIREMNPAVGRTELLFIRRSDDAIVGKYVYYWRRGGDFPTGIAHDSSFECPTLGAMSIAIDGLFIVEDH